mmetsp:Transcript_31172/g.44801  ORF Transcript_31172/g.44801 Transcript_31172/m.44801 type:complete len:317 (+) Transcript_31172:68-1018(+)
MSAFSDVPLSVSSPSTSRKEISSSISQASKFYSHLTVEEQRELFLWKYRDISRESVTDMMKEFMKHDIGQKGHLDEHEAMMLMEHRGIVKTAKELREMMSTMDIDKNHKLSFVEWCCAFFERSYEELNNFSDEDARQAALLTAKSMGEEARKLELEIEAARLAKELEAQQRAEALERESKMTGVAGMRAFFFRQVEGATDVTKTNEQQIKEEAARRKALREAKLKMTEAIQNASKTKSPEEIAAEVAKEAERQKEAELAAQRQKEEDEKAARAARKAALNEKWSVKSPSTDHSLSGSYSSSKSQSGEIVRNTSTKH